MNPEHFQIAIDGPVAAGKGTVSRLVAERLNFLYVDTGAMYRVTAYLSLQHNIPFTDIPAIVELLKKTDIQMHNPSPEEADGRLTTVLVNGEDVSWKIRTEAVGNGAAKVAQIKEVREILVEKQQVIASSQNVVMEGRDITYRVLPNAQLKIYLTGKDFVRANRRHLQLQSRGNDVNFEEVYLDLKERDNLDMTREADPLKIVSDAWVLDTSDFTINQVVDMIVSKAKVMMSA
ncbi:MAG: cytidylate kinase [Patescibacteria group bacterium]|nr:MAG: cytidylate kinase [Patescibacteria group bacterium]